MNEARKNGKPVVGVDDMSENLMLLRAVLEASGYIFFSYDSGVRCLELLPRACANLILLDIQMPVLDGFETCRRLRWWPDLGAIPVAFLTASKNAEDLRAGLDAGGNDFILKPFDVTRLLIRIAHWCAGRAVPPPIHALACI